MVVSPISQKHPARLLFAPPVPRRDLCLAELLRPRGTVLLAAWLALNATLVARMVGGFHSGMRAGAKTNGSGTFLIFVLVQPSTASSAAEPYIGSSTTKHTRAKHRVGEVGVIAGWFLLGSVQVKHIMLSAGHCSASFAMWDSPAILKTSLPPTGLPACTTRLSKRPKL